MPTAFWHPFANMGRVSEHATTIVRYWQQRQPELLLAIERHGITRPAPLDPPEHNHEPPGLELDW